MTVRQLPRRRAAADQRASHAGPPNLARRGILVGIILAVLTIGEYFVAVETHDNLVPLSAFAVVKAVLIVWYFMHVYRIWGTEAH